VSPCNTGHRIRNIAFTTFGMAASVLALAACGSSSKPSSTMGSAGSAPAVKFADCMRAHGVPNFPDPSAGGGSQFPSGISPSSPAFKSAQQMCAKYAPGTAANHQLSAAQDQRLLALSRCMRTHGESNFPDPTPSNLAASKQAIFRLDPSSPGFQKAAAMCGAPGLFYRAGQPAGAAPTGESAP
jgi:hypothetical protein